LAIRSAEFSATISAEKSATRVQDSKIGLACLFFKNCFPVFQSITFSGEVKNFALV
jgi:hypothetical protein